MTLVVLWCREKVELARGLSLELVIDRGKAGPYRCTVQQALYHSHVTGARQALTGTVQQYQHAFRVT